MPKSPPPPIMGASLTCLAACQNANDTAMPYRPVAAYMAQTHRHVRDGNIIKSTEGSGFWITADGRRLLALSRNARVLRSKRLAGKDRVKTPV